MTSIAKRITANLLAGILATVSFCVSTAPASAATTTANGVDNICEYAPWWPGCP